MQYHSKKLREAWFVSSPNRDSCCSIPKGKILLDDLEGGLETAMQAPNMAKIWGDLPRKIEPANMGLHHPK
jgi:hypothetical protein